MRELQSYDVFATARGFVSIAWGANGITNLRLPVGSSAAAEHALLQRVARAGRTTPSAEIAAVVDATKRYFIGEHVDFSAVAVDLGEQGLFFASVYALVRKLGWGDTTTYGAIAKALGAGPEAARDVGKAMASNPVPLIVPCHRVLAAGGKIGGFSAPGGSDTKLWMLELEGAAPRPMPTAPGRQATFGFVPERPALRKRSGEQ